MQEQRLQMQRHKHMTASANCTFSIASCLTLTILPLKALNCCRIKKCDVTVYVAWRRQCDAELQCRKASSCMVVKVHQQNGVVRSLQQRKTPAAGAVMRSLAYRYITIALTGHAISLTLKHFAIISLRLAFAIVTTYLHSRFQRLWRLQHTDDIAHSYDTVG